ncbi:hypothetical protein [Bradyrhizobium diazoefficiens]|uniref:hypothetical protein n=1 Tax=Bradyrhizobium TaxID=374 RepID=UPI0004B10C9A|nr:hypothetical protein [Bradyrhizobium diazoefficiens]PDT56782.1 hypothetical protein CO678_36050 [Bradyrhizobium diazoefficiens]QLD43668.1 hypothetical protein HUW42_23000 [Bradyrhizobium diazoefficiens]BBZ95226.1 hypothetical protein F07S3_50590 [Bradyrhizobium diazoefficiens]BCA12909.1 hypothetical protein BDHF08_47560 [Bradyrhizobium diazoefficiens]BCE57315.1 hypothetical protein XF5B_48270 [Bradyrhizobium diazoefficiens]
MTSRELLKRTAFAKRNPEWNDDLRGANIAIEHARGMVAAGKLTHREYKDYEAHLWHEMLDKMPMEVFSEMQADGSLEDLEAFARGYDDDRDSSSVVESRKAVERKVKADALEQKWLDGTIDDKTYAQLSRDHVGASERLDKMIADDDHDRAAHEAFNRNYAEEPDHENGLVRFLNENYGRGKKPDGSDVEPFSLKRDDRSSWEKATDDDGFTDLDKLADFDRSESGSESHHPGGYVDQEAVLDLGSSFTNNPNQD